MHTELPLLKDRGFAAALGDYAAISSGATTYSSGIGYYPDCGTIRSSIADSRVAPHEMEPKTRRRTRKNAPAGI